MDSSVETVSPASPAGGATPGPSIPWAALGWLAAIVAVLYGPVVQRMADVWLNNEDMGHGFFVPAVSLYIAWQKKDEILAQPLKTNWLGLLVVAWGGFQLLLGQLGAELFLQRSALVFTVIGLVWFLCGTRMLKVLALPLFLLFFMVPLPAVVYGQITFPLQLLASSVAEHALTLIGIPVLREGNILELPSKRLSVVEACSGIRSLLSLTFLSLVYGFFFEKKGWVRALLFFATIPIAIVANSSRVTLTGIITEFKPEYAEGFFHSLEGWVIFMVALVLLIGFHQMVNGFLRMLERARTEEPL